jgi:hypothetical protein
LRIRGRQRVRYLRETAIAGVLAIAAAGCDSTIHRQANIGGVDTLSLDAKQRLMLVGNRGGHEHKRVTCTEPGPDALVARAAALAAGGNFQQPGVTAGGNLAVATSETAASIGFRNQTIQMLRDGYFRLCEAYLNGALDKRQYEHMVTNADTFMVVVSALQVLGSNPTAPAVAISAGGLTATVTKDGAEIKQPNPAKSEIKNVAQEKAAAAKAEAVGQIVKDYLKYREGLTRYNDVMDARLRAAKARQR